MRPYNEGNVPQQQFGGEICRDFANGRCNRGENCRFQHDGGNEGGGGGRSPGRAVQVDIIKTLAESAYGYSA